MTLEEIKWIAQLFETGKMSTAAESLFISQPALSQCLQRVEKQLGFPLFQRINRRLVPTENAALFYEMSKSISNAYDSFLTKAAANNQEAPNTLVIGMPPYLSSNIFYDVLQELQKGHPGITFSIYEAMADGLEEALRDGKAQLVITNDPNPFADAVPHPLMTVDTVLNLRQNSPAKQYAYTENGKRYLDPVYLKDEPIAVTRAGQSSRIIAERLFHECGVTPHINTETTGLAMLYKYAVTNIGSSISPYTPSIHSIPENDEVVYYVPAKYKWSKSQFVVYTLPEVDKQIPRDIYQILQRIMIQAYTKSTPTQNI